MTRRREGLPEWASQVLSKIKGVKVRPVEAVHSEVSALVDRVTTRVGGPARLRVVLLLAGVLSLQSAEIGTIGALAAQLEKALRADNTELGLLTTAASLVGAVAALPVGVLADRANRVRMLVWATAAWSVGMAASGFADGYLMLLLTRLALGAVIGVSGPVVASLTGDLFPAKERARIYGMVLTGELVGSGLGLVISAELGAAAGWRAPFFVLAVPSLVLAVLLHRLLPEPARGGQSWLYPGAEEIKAAGTIAADSVTTQPSSTPVPAASGTGQDVGVTPPFGTSEVRRHAREREDVEPNQELVLREDPAQLSPWAAGRYVLRIRSNLVLIAASVLGNFFLAGIQAFALLYVETHFRREPATGDRFPRRDRSRRNRGDSLRRALSRPPRRQEDSRRPCPSRRLDIRRSRCGFPPRPGGQQPAGGGPLFPSRSPLCFCTGRTARRCSARRRPIRPVGPSRGRAHFCPQLASGFRAFALRLRVLSAGGTSRQPWRRADHCPPPGTGRRR